MFLIGRYEQATENNRDEDQGRHVAEQVTTVFGGQRVDRHDAGVDEVDPRRHGRRQREIAFQASGTRIASRSWHR